MKRRKSEERAWNSRELGGGVVIEPLKTYKLCVFSNFDSDFHDDRIPAKNQGSAFWQH
jgi:hypothetical protein